MEPIRTKGDLEKLISEGIDEDSSLEYKGSGSLAKSDLKKRELTKDVSAFANSAGGTIIFGIKESSGSNPPRIPEAIDPIDCREISKEWLDQIIGRIRPRILNVQIAAIQVGPLDTDFVYVVDVPQSSTAHQSLDHRYYARRNFESTPMEDYEIRDVMQRAIHPTIDVELRIIADTPYDQRSHIAIKVKNCGAVMARHYAVIVRLPIRNLHSPILPEGATLKTDDGPAYWSISHGNIGGSPLFPGSKLMFKTKFKHIPSLKPDPESSIEKIEIIIFADNMPKLVLTKSFETAHTIWT